MTTSETTGQSSPSQSVQPQLTTNPYVGILAVFMGAGLATLTSRLLSVGLPDLRGALGISFDDASWLPTAFNMATMFSGVFIVFLNSFWVRAEFCYRLPRSSRQHLSCCRFRRTTR